MAAFYSNIDLLALPSLNSTEAFGLVQIEAMMNNVPVVASDLPGVRQPALIHKMGKIIRVGDSQGLAESIISILENKDHYTIRKQDLLERYSPDSVAAEYEKLFKEIQKEL